MAVCVLVILCANIVVELLPVSTICTCKNTAWLQKRHTIHLCYVVCTIRTSGGCESDARGFQSDSSKPA